MLTLICLLIGSIFVCAPLFGLWAYLKGQTYRPHDERAMRSEWEAQQRGESLLSPLGEYMEKGR